LGDLVQPGHGCSGGMLDGTRTFDEIVLEVGDQYEGVPESAPEELTTFMTELEEGGFVGYEVEVSSS